MSFFQEDNLQVNYQNIYITAKLSRRAEIDIYIYIYTHKVEK